MFAASPAVSEQLVGQQSLNLKNVFVPILAVECADTWLRLVNRLYEQLEAEMNMERHFRRVHKIAKSDC